MKSFLNLLQYCFHFRFWVFGPKAHGISASNPGIEPTSLVWGGGGERGKVLNTGQMEESQERIFKGKVGGGHRSGLSVPLNLQLDKRYSLFCDFPPLCEWIATALRIGYPVFFRP